MAVAPTKSPAICDFFSRVQATDLDSGNYSAIRYSLTTDSGEASRLFRVDPVYGRIYTASAEQFFGKEGEHYVVQVRAYDNFGRVVTHSNEATVTVCSRFWGKMGVNLRPRADLRADALAAGPHGLGSEEGSCHC